MQLLVVGGNGFLGSAVCKTALARGWAVSSISPSGKPWTTPKGHSPAWASKVSWHAASAFDSPSYRHLLGPSTAVVHTLGTLFEGARYKTLIRNSTNPFEAIGALLSNDQNPLMLSGEEKYRTSYQGQNHHSATTVLQTYIEVLLGLSQTPLPLSPSPSSSATSGPRRFVYVSAEDIFRPFVPRGYIDSKRDAEADIATRIEGLASDENGGLDLRAIVVRPGLMYHPHTRPITTPLATLLQGSVAAHAALLNSHLPIPSPANILRAFASFSPNPPSATQLPPISTFEPLGSMARALETPPMHVDHVALAIIKSIECGTDAGDGSSSAQGNFEILGVKEMRDAVGWPLDGVNASSSSGNEYPGACEAR